MKQIKNVKELRRALKDGKREFRIQMGALFSAKTIYPIEGGRFAVFSGIDGTFRHYTARELRTETNIVLAMKRGAFVAEGE